MDSTAKELRHLTTETQERADIAEARRLRTLRNLKEYADRQRAAKKAEVMAILQPQFDAEAKRISSLVSDELWLAQAMPVVFMRESLRQVRKPVYPMLLLGKAEVRDTASIQFYYSVYLRKDGYILVQPSQHSVPATVPGDSFYPFSDVYIFGGEQDCNAVLAFLKAYTP